MNNTIRITSESKELIRKHVESLLLLDYKLISLTSSIKFSVMLTKTYNTVHNILDTTDIPQDLTHIIMTYINDIIIIECDIMKFNSHTYHFEMKTNDTYINYELYTFRCSISIDRQEMTYDIEPDTCQVYFSDAVVDVLLASSFRINPQCMETRGACGHSPYNNKLYMSYDNNIIECPKYNYIGIFNAYMMKYYNKTSYINVQHDPVLTLPKIYDHKKMKNMIVLVKILLHTFLGK